jgi:hypothetical protein
MKALRVAFICCLISISANWLCGCSTEQQNSSCNPSNSTTQQWESGLLYGIGLGAYQGAESNQQREHP